MEGIRLARGGDAAAIAENDSYITPMELARSIEAGRVYVVDTGDRLGGFLRYGLFWDNTPFMNMLWLHPEFRGLGLGRALVSHWEGEMAAAGYSMVLTSTQSDENAQYFYRKLGYIDSGSLILPGQAEEMVLRKML